AEKVFFTGSYWTGPGEMAAALACLAELEASHALPRMARLGAPLRDGVERPAAAPRPPLPYSRPPAIPFLTFSDDQGSFERSRAFAAACCARGVYLHPHHNWFLSAALTDDDLVRVLEVTDQAFAEVAQGAG